MAMKIFGTSAPETETEVEAIATTPVEMPESTAPVEVINIDATVTEAVVDPAFADDVVGSMDRLIHNLTCLRENVVAIHTGSIIGKAAFKKTVVKTREKMLPLAKDVKAIWRELHEIGKDKADEVESARKVKTPEMIKAEIDALQARLSSMGA